MLLATSFASLEEDYSHLKEYVQIWDVAVERQVELRGPDAHKLMSVRTSQFDLSFNCYVPNLNIFLKMRIIFFKGSK